MLNDAQQFASANGQGSTPSARRWEHHQRSKAAAAGQPGAANLADPSTRSVPGQPRQGGDRVAAAYTHSASHLLASAAEMCPLALEQLLL